MSALGQKPTYAVQKAMSALPPIATAKADSRKRSCLLYPRKRTLNASLLMSALGQKRTFSGIPFEITFNALSNRLFAAHEFLSSYLFVHLDVAVRQFFYQFRRCIGQLLIFVRIAVLLKPQTQEFFIEILRLFTFFEALLIGRKLPKS